MHCVIEHHNTQYASVVYLKMKMKMEMKASPKEAYT